MVELRMRREEEIAHWTHWVIQHYSKKINTVGQVTVVFALSRPSFHGTSSPQPTGAYMLHGCFLH